MPHVLLDYSPHSPRTLICHVSHLLNFSSFCSWVCYQHPNSHIPIKQLSTGMLEYTTAARVFVISTILAKHRASH